MDDETKCRDLMPDWLWTWVEWSANDAAAIRNELWFPSSSPGLCGGWARGENYWDDQEGEQANCLAAAIDSAIDGLPPGYKAAIQWVAGVQRVARPRRLEETFIEALKMLKAKVMARHMIT